MKKFCTKCGHEFEAIGREVICPSCKAQAAEDARHAAVLRAKRASWTGESVPVRVSGRASTLIRRYGAANDLPFAQALDDLLKASDFFKTSWKAWEDITPYKSRRMKKSAEETTQDVQAEDKPLKPVKPVKPVKQVAKATGKAVKTTSKTAKK